MKKTLILVAGLIGVIVLLASCGMLSTEVIYSPENPVVGEPVQFEADLDFDMDEFDEDEEFVCDNKKHRKHYNKKYKRYKKDSVIIPHS